MKKPSKAPEVTITTDLAKYLQRDEVRNAIRKFNDEYLCWDEIRYRPSPIKGISITKLWGLVKLTRRTTYVPLIFGKHYQFYFTLSLSSLQKKLHEIDLGSGGLPIKSKINEEEKQRYLISSIMEEAIASSQLEGAATTRKVAKEMLRTGRKPRNTAEKMILNNYQTITWLSETTGRPLDPVFIKEIQGRITHDTLEKQEWEGKFRAHDELRVHDKQTGEVLHVPPPHEEIDNLLKEYCSFTNSENGSYIHPIVKAAILHFLMGYIHPFEDGNGRTARAVMYWYLLKAGYWIFKFMAISRVINRAPAQYARAYLNAEADEYDITYFIKFQVDSISRALMDLREYIQRKDEEKKKAYRFLKIPGINERQARILIEFLEESDRIMSIGEVERSYLVVYQTARTDLLGLEKLGFLNKKISGKKLLFFRSATFESKVSRYIQQDTHNALEK